MSRLNGTMDLRHLRCVVAIADHGTFTDAATGLHLSQPALSHAIAKLERELGARLFDRTAAGAKVTAAGRALLDHARRAIAEAESGRAAVAAVSGVVRGDLRVVGVRTAAVETAQLVAGFHREYPGVHVMIEEPTGDDGAVELVRNGRCDIALIHTAEVPADLPAVRCGAQELVWVFPAAAAPTNEVVTSKDLEGTPMVAALSGTSIRLAQDGLLKRMGIEVRVVAECAPHPNTLLELVRGGLGATITSRSLLDVADTVGIAIRSMEPKLPVDLSVIRRRSASPAAEAFFDLMPLAGGPAVKGRSKADV